MTESTSLEDHLIVFKKIIFYLQTMDVKYDEEDLGMILLCSSSSSYATFRDTILYSCDTLTLEEVFDALFSKKNMKQLVVGSKARTERLVVRGRTQERNSSGDARSRSKFSNKDKTCRCYKKKGHTKFECYKLQNKNKKAVANQKDKRPEKSNEASVVEDEYSD